MFARVKSDEAQNKLLEKREIVVPMRAVTACGGLIFTQNDWRFVPAHEETSAKENPYLETAAKMPAAPAPKAAPQPKPQPQANENKTVRLINRRGEAAVPPAPAPIEEKPE